MRQLQRWVAAGSQNESLRRMFGWGYRGQLAAITAMLARSSAVRGVLLRRPGVKIDLYPGESDFDLTVVPFGDAAGVARVLRRIKRVCPALGETLVVPESELSEHFRQRSSSYYAARPDVLWWRGSGRPEEPVAVARHDLLLTLGELVRNQLWPALFRWDGGSQPVLSRDLCKLEQKVDWFEARLLGQPPCDLIYLGEAPILSRAERIARAAGLLERVARIGRVARIEPAASGEMVTLAVEGLVAPPSDEEGRVLRACAAPLESHGRIRIVPFRAGPLGRCVVLECDGELAWDVELAVRFAAAAKNLSESGLFLAFNYVIPQDACGRAIWSALDPLAGLLARDGTVNIERCVRDYELATARMLYHSRLRVEDPIYLTHLVFGSILPLTGKRPPLSPLQADLHAAYLRADLVALQRRGAFETYRLLLPLVERA